MSPDDEQHAGPLPRRTIVVGAAVVALLLVAVTAVLWIRRPPPAVDSSSLPGADSTATFSPTAPAPSPSTPSPAPLPPQFSGVSGDGAADGSFGKWRGSPVTIGGTWDDTLDAQRTLHTIAPGSEWGDWDGALDLAIGAIDESAGETWKQAAQGAYDARWRRSLTTLAQYWSGRSGLLYLRFAHEFNITSVPWTVHGSETKDFINAWHRFRALQKEIAPQALLVFCPNNGSTPDLGLDWRNAFPGRDDVDVMSVDSYNQNPLVETAAQFRKQILAVDSYGAPVGIEAHRLFAASVGLPMAVSEWGSNANQGDSPVYMVSMKAWFHQHAGRGPGQVPYEIYFNVGGFGDGRFQLYPRTRMPDAATAYIGRF